MEEATVVRSNTTAVTQWIEGTVGKVDASGFALAASGRAGSVVRRYLFSRYASPRPTLPSFSSALAPAAPSDDELAAVLAGVGGAVPEPDELPFPSADWPPADRDGTASPKPTPEPVQRPP